MLKQVKRRIRRRMKPNEYSTRKVSIINFCRECFGWDGNLAHQIKTCPSTHCPLWRWRMGGFDKTVFEDDAE